MSTKEERIQQLEAQLERVKSDAAGVASVLAAKVLGDRAASALEFRGSQSEDGQVWVVFELADRWDSTSPVGHVYLSADGQCAIEADVLPMPAEDVRSLLFEALDEREAGDAGGCVDTSGACDTDGGCVCGPQVPA